MNTILRRATLAAALACLLAGCLEGSSKRMESPSASPAPPPADQGSAANHSSAKANAEGTFSTTDHNFDRLTVTSDETIAENAPPAPPQSPTPAPMPTVPAIQRQIIKNGTIDLRVASLDSAEASLAMVTAANNGYVATSGRSQATGSARTGTVTIRVPAVKFESIIVAVRRIGTVEGESVTSQDVTEEYIDLNARLRTQQELEARIIKLLNERTGRLEEVIQVEQKLAEVRTTIEGIQGRLRFLSDQTGYSTLTVTLSEPGAVGTSGATFGGRIGTAADEGVNGLVSILSGLVTTVIALSPLIVGGIAFWLLVGLPLSRRRKARRTAAAAAHAAAARESQPTDTGVGDHDAE